MSRGVRERPRAIAFRDAGSRDRLPRRRRRCVGDGVRRHAGRAHATPRSCWSTGGTGRAGTGSTPIRSCGSTSPPRTTASSRARSGTTASTSTGRTPASTSGRAPAEICDYYARVLDEHLLPTGRVRFLGMSDYRGGNGDRPPRRLAARRLRDAREAAAQGRRRDLRPVRDPVASRSRIHGRARASRSSRPTSSSTSASLPTASR